MSSPSQPPTLKPLFLLADSQLLFWKDGDRPFLHRVLAELDAERWKDGPIAAYIGASNGDLPEYYELFRGAMELVDVDHCRHVTSSSAPEELDAADLIVLAGGDVHAGYQRMEQSGIAERVQHRYAQGAILLGVSAGAVQLGATAWTQEAGGETFAPLRLLPSAIDVHDEPEWERLHALVQDSSSYGRGLGIPSGGGLICHPDHTVEPVRRPVAELVAGEGKVRESLISPPPEGEARGAAEGQGATVH